MTSSTTTLHIDSLAVTNTKAVSKECQVWWAKLPNPDKCAQMIQGLTGEEEEQFDDALCHFALVDQQGGRRKADGLLCPHRLSPYHCWGLHLSPLLQEETGRENSERSELYGKLYEVVGTHFFPIIDPLEFRLIGGKCAFFQYLMRSL